MRKSISILEESIALVQHHDAITGTHAPEVTEDYQQRIKNGMNSVKESIFKYLKKVNQINLGEKIRKES